MSMSVSSGRLRANGSLVPMVTSPFTGGGFAAGRPTILVMHFTYGGSAMSSANWFKDPKNPGSSAHLVIDRNGDVIQCVNFGTVAWHAGKSSWKGKEGLNQHAIGIELANWGYLKKSASGWKSYTGVEIPNPVLAPHKNGNPDGSTGPVGWEPYPEAQFDAAVAASRAIIAAYPGIVEIVGHDDISKGRKWDPGPAFDMQAFRALVMNASSANAPNVYAVLPAEGLNLRSGPGTHFPVVRLLAAGTKVEPVETQGQWLMVSVLAANGTPQQSGWVHRHYLG